MRHPHGKQREEKKGCLFEGTKKSQVRKGVQIKKGETKEEKENLSGGIGGKDHNSLRGGRERKLGQKEESQKGKKKSTRSQRGSGEGTGIKLQKKSRNDPKDR